MMPNITKTKVSQDCLVHRRTFEGIECPAMEIIFFSLSFVWSDGCHDWKSLDVHFGCFSLSYIFDLLDLCNLRLWLFCPHLYTSCILWEVSFIWDLNKTFITCKKWLDILLPPWRNFLTYLISVECCAL